MTPIKHARGINMTPMLGRIPMRVPTLFTPALVVAATLPASLESQEEYRLSQGASVAQELASTTVTVEYFRPDARGRSPLFGGVVHWGEVWTPGANVATVLDLSADATVEGQEVPAGRWSMWMIPSEVSAWEMILDPRDTLFHTQRPEIGTDEQIRFDLRTETGPQVDVLTWSFPEVHQNTGTLQMAWGETVVPLDIEVESNIPETVVADEVAEIYAGEWTLTFERPPEMPADMPMPPPSTMTIEHRDNGHLVSILPPEAMMPPGGPPPEVDPSASARERERAEAQRALLEQATGDDYYVALVPFADGIFRLGYFFADGTLIDVENLFFEFEVEDGAPPRSFLVRDTEDRIMGRGERGG